MVLSEVSKFGFVCEDVLFPAAAYCDFGPVRFVGVVVPVEINGERFLSVDCVVGWGDRNGRRGTFSPRSLYSC